jgi:trans-2,3-dihydro-3-hydroxyanthranilate isomerase
VRTYRFVTVDVFTDRRFGGNPLAVFPDARGMTEAEMQSLAAEFNLSETTFVLPPEDPANTARVRIFCRTYEMPFAGHPNVGTGFVLAGERGGDTLRFEEIAGLVEVKVARDAAGRVTGTTIAAPQPLSMGAELPPVQVALCAGLEPWEVVTERHAPVQAGMGNPFVIAEVTAEALTRAAPDFAAFRNALAQWPALNGRLALYLYAVGAEGVRARMFAPLGGTIEDAATGSAATPLAGLLLELSGAERGAWDILQGVEMGRPSLLRTTAWRTTEGIRATVGGGCVPMLRGEITL